MRIERTIAFLALCAVLPCSPTVGAQTPSADPAAADAMRFDDIRMSMKVEDDGRSEMVQDMHILLRSPAAIAQYGQVAQVFIQGYSEVAFEDVEIQKPDGRRVAVKDARTEDLNPFGASPLPIPLDIRIHKITIPGIEPGDQLSYRIRTREKPIVPGSIYGEVKFIPLMGAPKVRFELDLPRTRAVRVRLREGLGASWEDVPSSPDRRVQRLTVSAPVPDPSLKGAARRRAQKALVEADVTYSAFESWDQITRWWWELSKERLLPDAATRVEAERLLAGAATPREKLERIETFAASRVRYLNVGLGAGRMQPRAAAEVLASRLGDCKDKHALVSAMASAAGLDLRPVFIHAVRQELFDDVPSPLQFNHMIGVARLGADPASWFWIDSTNPIAVPGSLMPSLRDKRAIVIEPDGRATLLRTPKDLPFPTRTETEAKGTLDASGELKGHVRWTLRSDHEVMLRSAFAVVPRERQADAVEHGLLAGWTDGKVAAVTTLDPSDLSRPFTIDFDVTRKEEKASASGEWALSVPLASFDLDEADEEADEHGNVVVESTQDQRMRVELLLPEGITARAPMSVSVSRPFGRYQSTYSVEGRMLKAERRLVLERTELKEADRGAYESLRRAVDSDEDQDFMVSALAAGALSAESAMREGNAAFAAKDYEKAASLFRKAIEMDPKIENGWLQLGRALRDKKDWAEARKAFDARIAADPFDELAYAERAQNLILQERWDEAEPDLLKQIEVAPFKVWSYDRMGDLRRRQRRYAEAAEFYRHVAQLEPKEVEHWIDLAWALGSAGNDMDAQAALTQARTLSLNDWQQVSVGQIYWRVGEDAEAGVLAEAALPSLVSRLVKMSHADATWDRYWTKRLQAAWQLIGAAALAKGDFPRAEKYLKAAWKIGLLPEAGWGLGLLRERQGRTEEANAFFAGVATMPDAGWRLPQGWKAKSDTATKTARSVNAADFVTQARILRLGPGSEKYSDDLLMMVSSENGFESLRTPSGSPESYTPAFERQLKRIGNLEVKLPWPDENKARVILGGLLSCTPEGGCGFVIDIPGLEDRRGH